jgi:hypothetical protein
MKDFSKNYARSDEAVDETANTSDQENVAPAQSDAPSVSTQETDLFANATKLPSESSGARKILKSSAVRASGQIVFGTNPGRLVQLDSELEYKVALILSVKPDLADLHEQVCFQWLDHTGKSRSHFFDFVTACKSGKRTGVIVKEASRLKSERLQREIRMIGAQAVTGFVDRVIVVTQRDIDPVDLHNAKLLHEVRHADLEADQAAETATTGLVGAVTVADLTAAIAMGSRGFRALARLIRRQTLVLLHHEIVTHSSLVRRAV